MGHERLRASEVEFFAHLSSVVTFPDSLFVCTLPQLKSRGQTDEMSSMWLIAH